MKFLKSFLTYKFLKRSIYAKISLYSIILPSPVDSIYRNPILEQTLDVIERVYNIPTQLISIRFSRSLDDTILGRATLEKNLIEINPYWWNNLSPISREFLVLHEALHLFHIEHQDEVLFTTPSSNPKDLVECPSSIMSSYHSECYDVFPKYYRLSAQVDVMKWQMSNKIPRGYYE